MRAPFLIILLFSAVAASAADEAHPGTCALVLSATADRIPPLAQTVPDTHRGPVRLRRLAEVTFHEDRALARFAGRTEGALLRLTQDELGRVQLLGRALPLTIPARALHSVGFRDERFVLVTSGGPQAQVASTETRGVDLWTLPLPADWQVGDVAVSATGRWLAVANAALAQTASGIQVAQSPEFTTTPKLFDRENRKTIALEPRAADTRLFDRLLFSPDERFLVGIEGGHDDGRFFVTVWDTQSGCRRYSWDLATVPTSPAFSPDGRYFALGDWTQPRLRIYDVAQGFRLIRDLPIAPASDAFPGWGSVGSLAFSPDSQRLVAFYTYPSRLFTTEGELATAPRHASPQPIPRIENLLVHWRVDDLVSSSSPTPSAVLPFMSGALGDAFFSPEGTSLFVGLTEPGAVVAVPLAPADPGP